MKDFVKTKILKCIFFLYYDIFSSNDYTKVGDLQLDMPPAIGSLNVKDIMIEKNDNAEGTIEFLSEAREFTGESLIGRQHNIFEVSFRASGFEINSSK